MPNVKDPDPSGIFSAITRPDSDIRAKEIPQQIGNQKFESQPVLSEDEWNRLKSRVTEENQ